MRRPATLLPAPYARLIGFVLLAGLGALQWQRMVESTNWARAVLWVLAAAGAIVLLIAAGRRPLARAGAALAGIALAVGVSGLPLGVLRPSRWNELGEGLWRGAEALGGARLPYRGTDPWPGETLELTGALLVLAAAHLAFWPRGGRRGHPAAALVVLLVLVVAPVAAMSTPSPLGLGAAVALAMAAFLFLERMPVRPGLGAAALAVAAVAVALPLGAAADREEPWFDYRSFAEGLGPVDPISFSWDHSYRPIDWPREGRELFRVKAKQPFYWKTDTLTRFDGERWVAGGRRDPRDEGPLADVAAPGEWTERVEVSLRRLQTDTLVGPGTILALEQAGRGISADWLPGRWLTSRELGRGDSYTVRAHVPQPTPQQLADASAGWDGRQADALDLRLRVREEALEGGPEFPQPAGSDPRYVRDVNVEFAPFGLGEPRAHYEIIDEYTSGAAALRRTDYRRTYRLAQRLRGQSSTAWDYVLRVNAHLRSSRFRYTERPPAGPPGTAPLEAFLFDTRAGYCQHFSGAMALLLRMGGVPARVAAGFSPGGFRKRRGEWVVRDVDAHSWVEAWFDEIGWVTLDPTPPATPARSQTAALDTPEYLDEAEEPEATAEPTTAPPARRPEGPQREQAETPGAAGGDGGGGSWPLLVMAGLALAGSALAAARLRRAPVWDLERELADVRRALERSGRAVDAGTTLAELERRLGGSVYLRTLRTARYGGRATMPTASERAEFRRELAAGLGWTGRLRSLWALPPRIRRRGG